jgi:hypothetical protein
VAGKVQVNVTRPTYAVDLLDEVRAHGFSAELRAEDAGATVEVEANGRSGESVRDLWLTVETWIADKSLPLVPVHMGEERLVLRPPAA